jgi:hypothetical protein
MRKPLIMLPIWILLDFTTSKCFELSQIDVKSTFLNEYIEE